MLEQIWIVWLVVSVLSAWVVLINFFTAVMTAKVLIEQGVEFHWFFKRPYQIGFLIGVALDIVFNLTAGCWIYRERPYELTFTSRCKRHKQKGYSDWRGAKAHWWCDQLNKVHEGHC